MMKRGTNVSAWRAILTSIAILIVVAMFSGGCSTSAPLPPKIAVGLDGLRNEAITLRGQIEKTVGALHELISKPQADLSPQFQSYTHELGILEDRIERTRQQRGATDEAVKDQFMAWDENLKQLHNEATRAGAAERRAATDATYSGIKQKIVVLRNEANPFLNDLQDLRQYLKSDLSKEGLRTMEPTAQRVFDHKNDIIKRLDEVIQALDNAIKSR